MSELNPAQKALLKKLANPWLTGMFMLTKLPSLLFWGIRIREITAESCAVTLPYFWFTRNPFRSIYFAAQAGAAELSTGALALVAAEGRNISMLVTGIECEFTRKARSQCIFRCEEGEAIFRTVTEAFSTGESREMIVSSEARDREGELVSRFRITWSFKKREGQSES